MRTAFGSFLACLLFSSSLTSAAEPLHRRIDALLVAQMKGVQPAPRADDAEFVRRIYLDLAGRIPTIDETRRFLASKQPDKRRLLIDRLLDSAEYPRRMQEWFHAMLMERRGENEDWRKFLREAFQANLPWDQLARRLLTPTQGEKATPGAAYFMTARLVREGAMAPVDVPGLTRDVGRLLAGVDLGCAQCHDHVSINDYKQADFQGLHMIFENVQNRGGSISEKIMTKPKEFISVFTQEKQQTPPRAPGAGDIPIATFPKGEQYLVPPDRKKRTPGVLKFSPLKELAGRLASAKNELFCRNIANRLWFQMMGRGLVEPLDLQHSDNRPSHPQLLKLLAEEFAQHKFDIKWFLRELALSECYQRSSALPDDRPLPPAKSYALASEKRLSAEQLFWSTLIATGEADRLRKAAPEKLEQLLADFKPLVEMKKQFLKTFANPPKEPEVEFQPTVKSALFLMHDEKVLALLTPQKGNLMERLSALADADKVADELFLSVLSREPSAEDRADVRKHLTGKKGAARTAALQQIAWALLSSTEYCVNH